MANFTENVLCSIIYMWFQFVSKAVHEVNYNSGEMGSDHEHHFDQQCTEYSIGRGKNAYKSANKKKKKKQTYKLSIIYSLCIYNVESISTRFIDKKINCYGLNSDI